MHRRSTGPDDCRRSSLCKFEPRVRPFKPEFLVVFSSIYVRLRNVLDGQHHGSRRRIVEASGSKNPLCADDSARAGFVARDVAA